VICLSNVVMLMSYFEALMLIRRWRMTVFVCTHPLERVRSSTILINYCARVFLLYWVGYGKGAAARNEEEALRPCLQSDRGWNLSGIALGYRPPESLQIPSSSPLKPSR
jgi:hypothetical protein